MKEIKIGDRVRSISQKTHEKMPEYYPEVGVIGIVTKMGEPDRVWVQWPEDSTSEDEKWYCHLADLEYVSDEEFLLLLEEEGDVR